MSNMVELVFVALSQIGEFIPVRTFLFLTIVIMIIVAALAYLFTCLK